MGFLDDMAQFEQETLESSRRVSLMRAANSANADRVVSEIEAILAEVLTYLQSRIPGSAGRVVVHGPNVPGQAKKAWSAKDVSRGSYPNVHSVERYWPIDNSWILTSTAQLVRNNLRFTLGEPFADREREEAARQAGIPGGASYIVFRQGAAQHTLKASQLLVAIDEGWTSSKPMGIPHWTTGDRSPYAALLDGPDWLFSAGFGITPTGKPALVTVSEQESWADGNPFRIDMYELGAWLGASIRDRLREAGA